MGQLLNRLRDFARTQMRSEQEDLHRAERILDSDDEELRRIIEELHRDHTEGRYSSTHEHSKQSQRHAEPVALPAQVLKAHTVLNAPVGASPEVIKKAYRQSIATWHPDRFATATATEQQQAHTRAHEINSAYVILRDHYDFR